MEILFFQNKKNPHKYQEIHCDGYGHYKVREVIKFPNGVVNYTGDGHLHRWHLQDLQELLKDYYEYPDEKHWNVIYAECKCCGKTHSYVMSPEEDRAYEMYLEKKSYGLFPGYIQEVFPKMPNYIRQAFQDGKHEGTYPYGICFSCTCFK